MKKLLFVLLLNLLVCADASAMGLLFTNVTKPVTATCVRSCNVCCLRQGCSSSVNILGLIEVGDSGIESAAKDNNIKVIQFVDKTETSFLFLFRKLTTIVYGD